jgi:hypothetical protein
MTHAHDFHHDRGPAAQPATTAPHHGPQPVPVFQEPEIVARAAEALAIVATINRAGVAAEVKVAGVAVIRYAGRVIGTGATLADAAREARANLAHLDRWEFE